MKILINLLLIIAVTIGFQAKGENPAIGFNKRDNYLDKTELGDPAQTAKFIDPQGDVSHLSSLNDSSLVDRGTEELRKDPMGKVLQNAEEKKIDAIERYKINPQNPWLKNSLLIEENPMAKTGGKGLSSTERVSSVKVEKTCTEGVDFNVDVGLELVLECEEGEDLFKIDTTILIPGVELLNRFSDWGHYVRKRYGVKLWVLHPSSPQKEAHAREFIANRLGVPLEEIGERITFPPNGHGTTGWDSEGQQSIDTSQDTFVWPEYKFEYQHNEKVKKFIEKDEYWQVVTEGMEQLAESNECYETERVCLKSGVKIFFEKYDVVRPCWYEKISYRCTSEPKDGCAHLINQECQLQDSVYV